MLEFVQSTLEGVHNTFYAVLRPVQYILHTAEVPQYEARRPGRGTPTTTVSKEAHGSATTFFSQRLLFGIGSCRLPGYEGVSLRSVTVL